MTISLPYPVLDKKGKAKFDKAKKLLIVTLPVQPFLVSEGEGDWAKPVTESGAGVVSASESEPPEVRGANMVTSGEVEQHVKSVKPEVSGKSHDRWVSSQSEEKVEASRQLALEVQRNKDLAEKKAAEKREPLQAERQTSASATAQVSMSDVWTWRLQGVEIDFLLGCKGTSGHIDRLRRSSRSS